MLGFLFANIFISIDKKIIVLGLLYIFIIGFIDEFIQSYNIARNADVLDLIFDIFGGALGIVLNYKYKK